MYAHRETSQAGFYVVKNINGKGSKKGTALCKSSAPVEQGMGNGT
jgi:hypothetical protein